MAGEDSSFDVIVIGSGMSGGWAAKEFCERGMKTLVVERGKDTRPGVDYVGENLAPWDMKLRDKVDPKLARNDYAVQSQCYAFKESTRNFFINDRENPYSTEAGKPYAWIRGDQVGGRSLTWARQTYRFSDLDFEANKKDGHGSDWPIRYGDLKAWYDYVETFVGVSGSQDGLAHLPDGPYLPPMEMNCLEKEMKARLEEKYTNRKMIIGRCAHLTKPKEEHLALGRGTCQYRDQCQRGCSFGAFFSSVSATLPAARRTGNMTLITDTHVEELIYDHAKRKATGVRVLNRMTGERATHTAKVIFVCASTFGSLHILLNSTSEHFPNGFANSSGVLGHYLLDHHHRIGATGRYPGLRDHYYAGRRPTGVYIPRFQNLGDDDPNDFVRGYAFQGRASRVSWRTTGTRPGIGADFKKSLREPDDWTFYLGGFGESLPDARNKVTLHPTKTDKWGLPQLHIDVQPFENEHKMRRHMAKTAREVLEVGGLVDIVVFDDGALPGLGVHEMGGARMGHDPESSVLNGHNQCHDVSNVFVTDGAAMVSSGCQNPSLTYMALTVRAVDYATAKLKAGTL